MQYVAAFAIITFLSTFLPAVAVAEDSVQPQELAGEVVSVNGKVFMRTDNPDKKAVSTPKLAQAGDPVYSGSVINTSSNGSIKVLLKDKSVIDLGSSALFKVDKFKANQGADREVELNMVYGSLRAAVTKKVEGKGKFHVRTQSATMGVRGTEFVVKSEVGDMKAMAAAIDHPDRPVQVSKNGAPAKTEVTVIQGQVDVKPGNLVGNAASAAVVSLTAGTQLTTREGSSAALTPVKLNDSQLLSVANSAKVSDNTFTKAITIDTSTASNSGNSSSPAGGTSERAPASAGGVASALGASAQATLATAIAAAPAPSVSFSELGVPGTFSVQNIASAPPVVQTSSLKHLRVVVVSP